MVVRELLALVVPLEEFGVLGGGQWDYDGGGADGRQAAEVGHGQDVVGDVLRVPEDLLQAAVSLLEGVDLLDGDLFLVFDYDGILEEGT